jgi:hypothetical protein
MGQKLKKVVEFIRARGHPQITALHPTTLMITKEEKVGPRGNCIIAVAANKGAADLSPDFKQAVRSGHTIKITLEVNDSIEIFRGRGHPNLSLTHPTDIVLRKSAFTCGRTLAIGVDKAASDISREFVARLRDPAARIKITVEACELVNHVAGEIH